MVGGFLRKGISTELDGGSEVVGRVENLQESKVRGHGPAMHKIMIVNFLYLISKKGRVCVCE